jgi:hypothetical protein
LHADLADLGPLTDVQLANVLAQVAPELRPLARYIAGHLVVPAEQAAAFRAADPALPAPVQVPDQVMLWQARAQCKLTPYTPAGGAPTTLFAAIDAYVEAHHADNPVLWEAWNMGNTVSRTGLFMTTLAPTFGIDAGQRDALLIAAAAIQA